MPIGIQTRSSKGSALTHTEMDANLNLLARNATTTDVGNIEIATNTEMDALADLDRSVTPGRLKRGVDAISALLDENQNNDGYITLANGLIINWGNTATRTSVGTTTETFAKPFPNNIFQVIVGGDTIGGEAFNDDNWALLKSKTLTNFVWLYAATSTNGRSLRATYIAIGN